ncbi:MAG TPA: hypothetical protein VGK54_15765 [Chloroflexota bacterium]|jgi:hypothetical protein
MEEAIKALGIFIDLLISGQNASEPKASKAPAQVVRPADPVPCVKPWVFGETKAQHEAKPCPATALDPDGIQQL